MSRDFKSFTHFSLTDALYVMLKITITIIEHSFYTICKDVIINYSKKHDY